MLCIAGIGLMTLTDGFSSDMAYMKGNIFCLICGVAYEVHIVATERAVRHEGADSLRLSILQLGTTGVISLIFSFIIEEPCLPHSESVWFSATVLGLLCTVLAFVIQTSAQKYTSASHVGVILSLEPLIAGFVAFAFAGETMTLQGYFGAALMAAGIFVMEIDFKEIFGPSA